MSAGNICDITINSIHTALLIISRSLLNLNDFFQWLFAGMCVRRRQSLALHKHGSDGKTLPKIVQWSVQRGTYLLLLSVVFLWNDNSEIFNLLLKKQTNCLMAARDDHVKFLFHIYLNINAGLKLWKLLEQWYENLISCFSIYKKSRVISQLTFSCLLVLCHHMSGGKCTIWTSTPAFSSPTLCGERLIMLRDLCLCAHHCENVHRIISLCNANGLYFLYFPRFPIHGGELCLKFS